MALITCPKCGKQFSEHANACPQCGISMDEALALIAKQEEEARLAAEREAAERERLRKEREAKEAEEARIRAEDREKWWKENRKKVWITVFIIIAIITAIVAVVEVGKFISVKIEEQKVVALLSSGDSCVAIYHFDEARDWYEKAYRSTENRDLRSKVREKNSELIQVQKKANEEYEKALHRLKILLDADDGEFNQYSNECLDKMIEIYPDRQETIHYKILEANETEDFNIITVMRANSFMRTEL